MLWSRLAVSPRFKASAELWPGEIRAEMKLSDGGGLERRPC